MTGDLLDLVGALLAPDLGSGAAPHPRGTLGRASDERPWASGVPETSVHRKPKPEEELFALKARVALLEQMVATLCEALVQSRQVDGGRLLARVRELQEAAERARSEAENLVECAGCRAKILRSEAHVRATGVLCERCHFGARPRPGPELVEKRHDEGGYRGGRVELVEASVPCAQCRAETPRSKTFQSGRGPICTSCHLEAEDE